MVRSVRARGAGGLFVGRLAVGRAAAVGTTVGDRGDALVAVVFHVDLEQTKRRPIGIACLEHRVGNVIDGDAALCLSLGSALVRVTVENRGHVEA